MRNHLSLSAFLLLALQCTFPQAATEAALAHAHATGASTKLPKIYSDMPTGAEGKITQTVKGSAAQPASKAKPAVAKASKPATKKSSSATTSAKAATPASGHSKGEGPRIVSILGGEQQ